MPTLLHGLLVSASHAQAPNQPTDDCCLLDRPPLPPLCGYGACPTGPARTPTPRPPISTRRTTVVLWVDPHCPHCAGNGASPTGPARTPGQGSTRPSPQSACRRLLSSAGTPIASIVPKMGPASKGPARTVGQGTPGPGTQTACREVLPCTMPSTAAPGRNPPHASTMLRAFRDS